MRAMVTTAAVMAATVLAGCQQDQYRVVTDLPPPVFGPEVLQMTSAAPPVVSVTSRRPAPPAVRAPDPAWAPRRPARRWRYVIVHHSATDNGNARRFDRFHREVRGWDELGYHFVIGNGTNSGDGQVEVGSRWPKQKHGAHCKTTDERFNDYGIGICLVGDFEKSRPTAAQLANLKRLVTYLAAAYRIAPENILGHGEAVARVNEGRATRCPGRYLDMQAFRRTLRR